MLVFLSEVITGKSAWSNIYLFKQIWRFIQSEQQAAWQWWWWWWRHFAGHHWDRTLEEHQRVCVLMNYGSVLLTCRAGKQRRKPLHFIWSRSHTEKWDDSWCDWSKIVALHSISLMAAWKYEGQTRRHGFCGLRWLWASGVDIPDFVGGRKLN